MTRTRFAPSPTGLLHLGHAYAAKVAHDLARHLDGEFLLRFEDIDHHRVREEYYGSTEADLRWLGLLWDGEPLRQSSRMAAYEQALARLRMRGVVYPCFCSRREIEAEATLIPSAPHGPEGPLYPGTCRSLTRDEQNRRLADGQEPAWRLNTCAAARMTGGLDFTDLLHGTRMVQPGLLGDVILARKDIGTSYHLAVVVDDAHQQISHVTRGEDLLASTHIHRLLQSLLGLPAPIYVHHSLVTDESGRRLAKRGGARSIRDLRQSGQETESVLAGINLHLERRMEELARLMDCGAGGS